MNKRTIFAHSVCLAIVFCFACSSGSSSSSDAPEVTPEATPGEVEPGEACPEGSELLGGLCLYPCPEGWTRNAENACQPPTPDGWLMVDGLPVPPCPEGMEADGVLCRPPADSLGPSPDTGLDFNADGMLEDALVLYVDQATGSAVGPGTQEAPFAQVTDALAAIPNEETKAVLIIGRGSYPVSGKLSNLLNPTDPLAPDPPLTHLQILGAAAGEGGTALDLSALDELRFIQDSLHLEIARLRIEGGELYAEALKSLSVNDCSFVVADNSLRGIVVNNVDLDTLFVSRCSFTGGKNSVEVSNSQVSEVSIASNLFSDCGEHCVTLNTGGDVAVTGNHFSGCYGAALYLKQYEPTQDDLVELHQNFFDQAQIGIELYSAIGAQIYDNSFLNLDQASLHMHQCIDTTVTDIRTWQEELPVGTGEHLDSVQVNNCSSILLSGPWIGRSGNRGVRVCDSTNVSVEDAFVTESKDSAIHSESSTLLRVESCRLTNNSLAGVVVIGGSVDAVNGNQIWGNGSKGVHVRIAEADEIKDNQVVGNNDVGLSLRSLVGTAGPLVTGNRFQENTAIGLLAVSIGVPELHILDNDIIGTRPGSTENIAAGVMFGDGAAIVTGTDGLGSQAEMTGNTVHGNTRLGVIVHGAGTLLEIDQTDFASGNGWGPSVCLGGGGDPHFCGLGFGTEGIENVNLIQQFQAEIITGPGSEQEPNLLETPLPGMDQLGGGGDPH